MIVVKKVVKVLLFILCFILGIFIYPLYKTSEIMVNNRKITSVIKIIKKNNSQVIESNSKYEEEINKIKETEKDKLEELAIWKKAKTKLEEASSQ